MEDLKLTKMSSEIKSYINEGCDVEDEEHFVGANKIQKRSDGEKGNCTSQFGGGKNYGKIVNIYR